MGFRFRRSFRVMPGLRMNVSTSGVSTSALERIGALTAVEAGETVVPIAELDAARRQIRELQRLLGKKTLEAEILKEAMEVARDRKWIARSPLLPGDDR